jgi:hypothetical protein
MRQSNTKLFAFEKLPTHVIKVIKEEVSVSDFMSGSGHGHGLVWSLKNIAKTIKDD